MNEKIDKVEIKDEDVSEMKDFTPEELADDTADWKVKAGETLGIAKRRTTQLGKAKSYIQSLEQENENLKKTPPPPPPQDKKSQSEELDYGHLAFYNTKSGVEKIETPEEMDFLKTEMEKSKFSQKELLENDYFISKFKKFKDQQAAKLAAQEPAGQKGQPSAKNTVDYWISRGETPPDTEEFKQLRRDIVNEKIRRDKLGRGVQGVK